MSFEIFGLDEAISNIENMGTKLDKKTALRKGAEIIQKAAKQKIKRGEEEPHLADNIIIVEKTDAEGNPAVEIGPSKEFFYGSFNEFGTSQMPARPFLEPAYLEKRNEAVEIIGKSIGGEIK